MESMDRMHSCGGLICQQLEDLPGHLSGAPGGGSVGEANCNTEDAEEADDGSQAAAERHAEADRAATPSEGNCSGPKKNRSLDAKYKEVWEARKLLLTATFFPMTHEENIAIMHSATQGVADTRQQLLQAFLSAQAKVDPENERLMGVVDTMLYLAKMHIRHIALHKTRLDKSISFIDELQCSADFVGIQECILGQFRSYPSQMVPMADGKHLFEADADDHGFLYLGMCSLFAAPQAVLAGMIVADDKEPQWAEDGAGVLAGSKAYREDWHNWMAELFEDDQSVPPMGELAGRLSQMLDDDSAAAAKRDFRLQTLSDSNDVDDIAAAIAATAVLIDSADTDDLDNFAQPFQMDGHRQAISGASTAHAVPQVVGILRPEMGSPEHRVVVMQQQKESPSTIIRTAPWSLAPGGRKERQAVVVESDSVCVTVEAEGEWAPGDSSMNAVLRFTESGWLTGTRIAMEKLRNLNPKQLRELKSVAQKKGVWLEHRSKGKLVDAIRTYWLVDDQELAAFLPEEPEEEPISVADVRTMQACPNAHLGCPFEGSNNNSLNAHLRFCTHTEKTKNMRDMRASAQSAKTKVQVKAGQNRASKKPKQSESTSTKEARAKRSKAMSKQQSQAAAQRGSEPSDVDPERAMAKFKTKLADAQQVMHSCWWCGGDCACADQCLGEGFGEGTERIGTCAD